MAKYGDCTYFWGTSTNELNQNNITEINPCFCTYLNANEELFGVSVFFPFALWHTSVSSRFFHVLFSFQFTKATKRAPASTQTQVCAHPLTGEYPERRQTDLIWELFERGHDALRPKFLWFLGDTLMREEGSSPLLKTLMRSSNCETK